MTRYAPQWLQAGVYGAAADRRLIGALWPAPASSGCAVTVATGMVVNVDVGQVAVPSPNNTGSTLCTSDAPEQVTVTAAPPTGQERYDLIVCQARGADLDGGANNDFVFVAVAGVAGVPPAAVPAVPAGCVALAQVHVPGGAAALVAANLLDVRPGPLAVGSEQDPSRPRGCVARFRGPASVVVASSTSVTTVYTSPPFPTVAGRLYLVHYSAGYYGSGSATNTNAQVRASLDGVDAQMQPSGSGPTGNIWGRANFSARPLVGDGANHTVGVNAISGAPAGASLTFAANNVDLIVVDVGLS